MKIIGFTGLSGAGKSTIVDYISKKYNFPILRIGDILRNHLIENNITPEAWRCRKIAEKFSKNGKSLWTLAKGKIIVLKSGKVEYIIIDSLKGKYDLEFCRKIAEKIIVIGIFADQNTRFMRNVKRKRIDYDENIKNFQKNDLWNFNFGVGKLFVFSDFVIDTNLFNDYSKIADRIIKKIKNEQTK